MLNRAGTAVVVAALVGVAGCATNNADRWRVEPIPDGTRLTLERRVPVSAYSGQAHVQAGEPVKASSVNRFEPACRIRFRADGERPDHVGPGTFELSGFRTWRGITGAGSDGQVRLAAESPSTGPVGAVRQHSRVAMSSPEQPAVHEMVCQYEESKREPHLGMDDIEAVFDDLAVFERP